MRSLRAQPAVPRRRHHQSLRGARRHFYAIFCGSAGVSDDCNEQGFATVASDRPAHSVIETLFVGAAPQEEGCSRVAVSPRALWAGSGRTHVSKTSAGSKQSRLRVCVQFKKALCSGSRIRGTSQFGTLLGLRHSRNSRVFCPATTVHVPGTSDFPYHSFSNCHCTFSALTCKFCSAGRPKQPTFCNSSFFF